MANQYQKTKRILGVSLIAFALIFFALTVIPNFALTSVALGVFGIAWYAILLLLILIGVGMSMNLKYVYSAKFTTYLVFAVFSVLALLHTIFSTQTLSSMQGFASYKDYLSTCYSLSSGITVGGAFLGVFVYFFRAIFGMVGVYCVYVMMSAIFVGIVLDKLIYGTAKQANKPAKTNQQKVDDFVNSAEDFEPLKETNIDYQDAAQVDETLEEESEPSSAEIAKKTIFQNFEEEQYINPSSSNSKHDPIISREQARNTLFGNREVPDITLPNDKERDEFMKNYRETNNVEPETENDDISELFSDSSIGEISEEQSQAYRRNFVDEHSSNIGHDTIFDSNQESNINFGEQENDEIKPIASRGLSRESFGRRGGGRAEIEHASIDDEPLGTNLSDKAKAQNINFDLSQKPNYRPQPIRQDKQMAMRAVRYNSIPISNFVEYAETHEDHTEEYNRKSAALEKVLSEFGVDAKVVGVVRGPKVTRYEMTLPAGVSTNKVTSIENNIAMALMSKAPIRIEAPIPGKNAIGVELENDKPSMVGMRELLESPEFSKFKDPLPIAIGKDINGSVVIKSLPKMVHMLVAGSTGSGKSIFIHAVMMSILFKYSPEDVRFIMIDPKRVEFTMYNKLPHLILPEVLCDHDKALNALKWAVAEMEKRFQTLQENEVQNIEQYNKTEDVVKRRVPKMPYLVIVVDELAELMGNPQYGKDFDHNIQRITQLGRACGIHMVIATQRPSVNVITGTIKNNCPTRVSFKVKSFIDSKTILDEPGAENLLGAGDMLFAPQDSNAIIRLQAAFCNNDEIRNALKYVKDNNEATYDDEIKEQVYKKEEPVDDVGEEGASVSRGNGMDELMQQAVDFARSTGKISASVLQRRFRIGYNRAASIVDKMIEFGWVGPSNGSKPRDFNISDEQYNELFGSDSDDGDILF